MKISVNRLRELVPTTMSTEELAQSLTMAGLEVEAIDTLAPQFSKVCVARIVSADPHPNAEKLRVCRVEVGGKDLLQIVCGAPNARVGLTVPCARVGAKLPGLEIRAAKLRGVESFGMLCSAAELGLSSDQSGLMELAPEAEPGVDIRQWLGLDDEILTLKVTPNRGDCLSYIGVARDFAAVTGLATAFDVSNPVEPTDLTLTVPVTISNREACGQYFGRVLTGLDINASSPEWLRRRLEQAGLRPISPLVDITNLVMIEIGQPMHAFDFSKLKGGIDVRFARAGEQLKLLTGVEAALDKDILAISDETGPIAAGGVMGGESTMCSVTTSNVFFEAAWFSPEAIRGKAKVLGVHSDAAYRFERGVDPSLARRAIEWATQLARDICGTSTTQIGPIIAARGSLPQNQVTQVRYKRVEHLIGMPIEVRTQIETLKRVGCQVDAMEAAMQVVAPSHRFDLGIEEDFIEEIARIHGYDRIPERLPESTLAMLPVPSSYTDPSTIKRMVARLGYHEVINYSFVDPEWEMDLCSNTGAVSLENPISSNMTVMRSSLVGGLIASLRYNLDQGESRVRLFEVGRCFVGSAADATVQPERLGLVAYGPRVPEQWGEGGQKGPRAEFFSVKGDLELLLGQRRIEFEPAIHPAFHPGRSASIRIEGHVAGVIGELHPRWVQKYSLRTAPILAEIGTGVISQGSKFRFADFSRMQRVRRDIALNFSESCSFASIRSAVWGMNIPVLCEFEPFDIYRGPSLPSGQKSVAFRVVMQDTERTLTDIDADLIVSKIIDVLGEKFGATIRK
ncbi:MAG: phenylalanine--tRNA ligase subunit beta [Betaproteobacteria bacterium]|nr:phenylalanine--tRNA ligase subunit beta [Betaproteobacteria bacterium]